MKCIGPFWLDANDVLSYEGVAIGTVPTRIKERVHAQFAYHSWFVLWEEYEEMEIQLQAENKELMEQNAQLTKENDKLRVKLKEKKRV